MILGEGDVYDVNSRYPRVSGGDPSKRFNCHMI